MTPHIRPMAADDLDVVIALAESTPGAPHWLRSEYSDILERSQIDKSGKADNPAPAGAPSQSNAATNAPVHATAFVALADNQLIGFATTRMVLDTGQIESIVVATAFRRRGIGAALLEAVLGWAREHGVRRIELEVRESNAAAIALYKTNGFEQEGVRKSYYRGPSENALLMSLPLDDLRKEK